MDNSVQTTITKLLGYCEANDWSGHDPYDALNSKLFRLTPILNFKLPRLAFTQTLKRSPVNLRRLALVPRTQNPKAISLFLSSFVRLSGTILPNKEILIERMIERLIALRSPGIPYWCWGYPFPWQMRTELVPAGAPNLVCTSFVGEALLDVYELSHDSRCLEMAVDAAEYILNELYWTDAESVAAFSYPLPSIRVPIHNANFLGAALLSRVYRHTGDVKFRIPALKVASYSSSKQRGDGSWHYGEASSQRWIDNFHSGYNLCSLQSIGRHAETRLFDSGIHRGFEYYKSHFFREDSAPRYFHNSTYPIDIHCVAQSIITLLAFSEFDPSNIPLARSVFKWSLEHMWSGEGFFYYRMLRLCKIRTPYMRWSQAWMLLAMSMLQSIPYPAPGNGATGPYRAPKTSDQSKTS